MIFCYYFLGLSKVIPSEGQKCTLGRMVTTRTEVSSHGFFSNPRDGIFVAFWKMTSTSNQTLFDVQYSYSGYVTETYIHTVNKVGYIEILNFIRKPFWKLKKIAYLILSNWTLQIKLNVMLFCAEKVAKIKNEHKEC